MSNRLHRSRRGFTLIELLTVIAIIAVLLSVLAPAINHAREEQRNTQCKNQLKQLGLALHNYHETFNTFPPGWTHHHEAPGDMTRYGWIVFITPFMDQAPLFKKLEFNQQKAVPEGIYVTKLASLRCPSDRASDQNPLRGNFGTSNYSGNFGDVATPRLLMGSLTEFWPGQVDTFNQFGPQVRRAVPGQFAAPGQFATPSLPTGVFRVNSKVRIRDMRDGTTNCFLAGERSITSGAGIWMGVRGNQFEDDQVTDCSFGNEINSGFNAFSSGHPRGSQFVLGDGSVRYINEKINSSSKGGPEMGTYQRLSNIADGNVVGNYE